MIISAVNLVNNYKFSDFIIDKITEEQRVRDEETRRKNKRHSLCVPVENAKDVDFSVKKRTSLRGRAAGESSRFSKALEAETSLSENNFFNDYQLVTIETTDSYTLIGDPTSLHISLKKPPSLLENNVFRKLDFTSDVTGQSELTVFQLHSNPTYYLATTQLRHLELQSYCEDTLEPGDPDDRFFRCFQSEYGVQILQPHAHKGYYIHHIDDFITIRKLELNFRPPEEFFLHLKTIQSDTFTQPAVSSSTDSSQLGLTNEHVPSKSRQLAIPDISKSSLKRKDSKKNKQKDPRITPKAGMLGCFGLGSKKKKDKTKR